MLDSLKDMYISYPFMPLADPPEWFRYIKDLRVVVVLDAVNFIPKYKNNNAIQAYLKAVDLTAMTATVSVVCLDLLDEPVSVTVPVANWSAIPPGTQSYMLIDSELAIDAIPDDGYELQPDTLVFMQKAPKLTVSDVVQEHDVRFKPGHNVSITSTNGGVLLYGAPNAGTGVATATDDDVGPIVRSRIPVDKQGLGITNMNGFINAVRLDGTFPVEVPQQEIFGGTVHVVYKDV